MQKHRSMRNIKKFENEAAYEAFKASEDFVTPNLSWCVQENTIKRNKYGKSIDALKLTLCEEGKIGFFIPENITSVEYIEYSTDGENWTRVDNDITQEQNIVMMEGLGGDFVYVRGQATAYAAKAGACCFQAADSTEQELVGFNAEGDILSLLGTTNFADTVGAFDSLFAGSLIVDASKLVLPDITADECYYDMFHNCTSLTSAPALPATTLADGCYRRMFYGCTSLTSAPVLPATTLAYECYDSMFRGCTSLEEVTMLAITVDPEYQVPNWLDGAGITTTSKIIINDDYQFVQSDLNYSSAAFAVYNQSGELIWDYVVR